MKKNIIITIIISLILTVNISAQKKSKLPVEIQKLYSQMVYIKGGSFNLYQEWIDDYKEGGIPQKLKSFYAQKYEVSRNLWFYVMEQNNVWWEKEKDGTMDMTKPANGMSWYEAIDFCNKLSKKAGLTPCYDTSNHEDIIFNEKADGFRLPTEAEWEFLARGGTKSRHSAYAGNSNTLEDIAWTSCGYYKASQLMNSGLLKPNELGLYDLAGNVWEYCWDKHSEYPENRVIRGGAWDTSDSYAMLVSNHFYHINPDEAIPAAGLRLVKNAGSTVN